MTPRRRLAVAVAVVGVVAFVLAAALAWPSAGPATTTLAGLLAPCQPRGRLAIDRPVVVHGGRIDLGPCTIDLITPTAALALHGVAVSAPELRIVSRPGPGARRLELIDAEISANVWVDLGGAGDSAVLSRSRVRAPEHLVVSVGHDTDGGGTIEVTGSTLIAGGRDPITLVAAERGGHLTIEGSELLPPGFAYAGECRVSRSSGVPEPCGLS